ncbi:hypothetical protein ENSA7_25850 [Enhygromyxa salina]|uniref:Uncharacterized protein n=1 Tax=Enhygromyxa salina TaxID=215803 RepID=A0A2S9YR71_9BACT|nr:hypothetical protein ENSA7_25850 [Enhygromyxa salina]
MAFGLTALRLATLQLVFDQFDGPPGRAVLLDTLEFHRNPSVRAVPAPGFAAPYLIDSSCNRGGRWSC